MSEMDVVIGLDLGTSGVKAVAIHAQGGVVKAANRAVSLMTDDAGKAEQSVAEVWQAVREVLGEIETGLNVKAICVSGAMHSVVTMDEAGNILGHAMTWADQRCAPVAERMRHEVDVDAMYRRTGCPFSSLYHPARLRRPPEVKQNREMRRIAAIKDVVIQRLTGKWCSDASVASATGLMDIRSWRWDEQALELAGITAEQLPGIVAPTDVIGTTAEGVPVIAGASDGALANVGAAGFDSDATVITLGTSGAVRRIVREPRLDQKRRTWCYVVDRGRWLHGGAINSGGIAVQHAVKLAYGEGEQALKQAHAEAETIAPGCDGLTVLPFVTGERGLIWPPEAQWTVIGRTARHGPAHLVRATMEAVAYCIAAMGRAVIDEPTTSALLTGGVVRSGVWRQIVADVTGLTLEPVEAADASAVGAAIMGWRALGKTIKPPETPDRARELIVPNAARHAKYVELFRGFQASCSERSWLVS